MRQHKLDKLVRLIQIILTRDKPLFLDLASFSFDIRLAHNMFLQMQHCDERHFGAVEREKPDCKDLGYADVEDVVGAVERDGVDF